MSELYPLLIFAHVVGAMGVYMALGIETVAMRRLRLTPFSAAARTWLDVLRRNGRLAFLSMLLTLAAGMWMAMAVWGHQAWIALGFAGLVAMALLEMLVTRPGVKRLNQALGAEAEPHLSSAFRALAGGAALTMSLRLRAAIGLGILALMTMKPGYGGSLEILGVAVASVVIAGAVGAPRRKAAASQALKPTGRRSLPCRSSRVSRTSSA